MAHIVCRAGRLMEFRFPSNVNMEFIKTWGGETQALMKSISATGRRTLAIGDLRDCHLMARDVTDAIVSLLKTNNPMAERTVVVVGPDTVFGLQIWRIFKDSESEHRRITQNVEDALDALAPVSSPEELARAREFLTT